MKWGARERISMRKRSDQTTEKGAGFEKPGRIFVEGRGTFGGALARRLESRPTSVYFEHLRKKEETKQWKLAAAKAYRKGEPIPPKPERDNDRRERLAEQRLSAQRSQARDRAEQLDPAAVG
jgi:HD-GYP domain-containing protein (c-di-GMP phosphodiesterase class II)